MIHGESDSKPTSAIENRKNGVYGRAKGESGGRGPEPSGEASRVPHPTKKEAREQGDVISRDVPAHSPVANEGFLMPLLVVLGVALWCISVMAMGVNLAESAWEWVWILAFGTAIPMTLLWQANRLLAPHERTRPVLSAKDKEKELLEALAERGEITPITAAMRTSLTSDEAAAILEGLARKGYLRLQVEEGVEAYALREPDRRGLPGTAAEPVGPGPEGGEAPQPLAEDLSERELEVLALLASGRTNSEIAKDLFVAAGTVKSHANNVYRKLGARNRAEALARARELNLLP